MTGVSADTTAVPPAVFGPAAEAALAGLSVATVIGFARVFDGAEFLPPMIAVAVLTHLVLALARRRGWGVLRAAAVAIPVVGLLCTWLVLPGTTFVGLPSGDTLSEAASELSDAWQQFATILAPAPPLPGFVLASCLALFAAVFLADWAAFRLWSAFEAVVPATTLFVFCALLHGAQHELISAVVYLVALLLFLLLHRMARQESGSGWLVGDTGRGPGGASRRLNRRRGPIVVGVSLVAVAVLAAALVGPRLPGAGGPPVLTWRMNPQQNGERKAISPLVRIRDRLLNQPDVPLFRVKSDQPAYWRLTSLESFDGEIWKAQARFGVAEGELPGESPEGETDLLDQSFTVISLPSMIWVPAAFRPVHVVSSSVGLNFNDDSSTLIVAPDSTLDGATYTIRSAHTRPSAEELRTVTTADIPEDVKERYLDLPDDFSSLARQTAMSRTQGKERPYDIARALQDFFRNTGPGGFDYDTSFDLGHGENAIDAFLRQRRGFCEQFAGTFAAMARAVGLPARVAVGFTPGVVVDPNQPDVYEVSGRQTHAWPEVHLGRFGWVAFEPTPGRGVPNAPWTGVEAQQDVGPRAIAPAVPPVTGETTPGTMTVNPDPAPPTTAAPETSTSTTTTPASEQPVAEGRGLLVEALVTVLPVLVGVAVLALGVVALVALYAALLGHLHERRRRERRARAVDASARVLVAWQECLEALRPLGLVPRGPESHDEFATRVAPRLGDAAPDLVALAEAVDHADYAQDLVSVKVADTAEASAAAVVRAASLLATPLQVWTDRLDPRPLLERSHRRPHHSISM